jgi:hypothetical protein
VSVSFFHAILIGYKKMDTCPLLIGSDDCYFCIFSDMSDKKVETEEFIWNFAFGSNMSSKILNGRRNLQPLEKVAASVKDYRLDFFAMLPYVEPGMGTIEPAKGEECHGLLVKFSAEQFRILYDSEGGPDGNYSLLELQCSAYDGRTIKAYAFQSRYGYKPEFECLPSKRYLGIVRDGAKECNLDGKYLEKLEKEYRAYEPDRLKQIVFIVCHLPLLLLMMILMSGNLLLRKLNFPFTLTFLTAPLFKIVLSIVWFGYDNFWSKVLGNGGKYPRKSKK